MKVPRSLGLAALVATAMPHISAVAHALDQSCHLTVLSDTQIVVIARVEAPGELGFAVRLGYRRRVDHSTSGRVLAGFFAPGVLVAVTDEPAVAVAFGLRTSSSLVKK